MSKNDPLFYSFIRKAKSLTIFLIFINSIYNLNASHIVGGEMNYRCLGNNQYEIRLTIYRDCFYGNPEAWFDNPASVGFFDSNNMLVRTVAFNGELRMLLMNNDTLDPTLTGTCFVVPPNVCVHTTTYIDTVDLPFLEGGYQLSYQRCCRNQTIQNILRPDDTGATFGIIISEEALLSCNSNARFVNWPPIYICVNEPIEFDHSAVDLEGDSLVYRLCIPLTGASPGAPAPRPPNRPPYLPVEFAPGFDLNNVLGGIPLEINSETGFLTGTPSIIGQFVVGVCVDEYRGDSIISTTRRDFQYNIGQCGMTTAAFFTSDTLCSLQLNIVNQSQETDSAIWIISQDGNTLANISTYHLNYLFPEQGVYNITLIANPGSNCVDTFSHDITVFDSKLNALFTAVQSGCSLPFTVNFTDLSSDSEHVFFVDSFIVLAGSNRIVSDSFPDFIVFDDQVSNITSTLYLQNDVGCKDTFSLTIPIILLNEPILPDSVILCFGTQMELDLAIENPGTGFTITWSPASVILNGQGTSNVTVNSTGDGWVFVEISGANNCLILDSIFIDITDEIPDFSVIAEPQEIYPSQSSQLSVFLTGNYEFQWSPPGSLNNSIIQNPIANPLVTTLYSVTVTDPFGCIKTGSVELRIIEVECDSTHVFIPNLFSPNDDGVNDFFNVSSNILESFELIVYNRWGNPIFTTKNLNESWDGTYSGKKIGPDTYAYYFRGICLGGIEIIRKGNVSSIR
ncbi:MAG: gliding motility-associated C-terminal domain-containing protein [Saprospiraceae bacterium]|nr:gliding motility-associated C-terminal domain-containing protein [Saprospiraceae bacterium]